MISVVNNIKNIKLGKNILKGKNIFKLELINNLKKKILKIFILYQKIQSNH